MDRFPDEGRDRCDRPAGSDADDNDTFGDTDYDAVVHTGEEGDDVQDGLPIEMQEASYAGSELNESLATNPYGTVKELSGAELAGVADALENVAQNGDRYETPSVLTDAPTPRPENCDHGYKWRVPKSALEAEGLDYDVEITTMDATDAILKNVELAASRTVVLLDTDGEEPDAPIGGKENKIATFFSRDTDYGCVVSVDAYSFLAVPGDTEAIVDMNAPLLTRDELAAIMRAVHRIDEQ